MLDNQNPNTRDWIKRRDALRAQHDSRSAGNYGLLRDALCDLVALCRDAPVEIGKAYREIPEEVLAEKGEDFRNELANDFFAWSLEESSANQALQLGAQLRALDKELIERPEGKRAPTSVAALLHSRTDSYVIPRPNPRSPSSQTGPGNSFGRRGTPHHRIVPRCISSYRIKPIWEPRLSLGQVVGADHLLGAALFPGLKLERDDQFDRFVPKDVACEIADEQLEKHVRAAFEQPLLAAVWPELTMPPSRLELLKNKLWAHSAHLAPSHGPSIVVAGSWYEKNGIEFHNVMRILDKSGVERWPYRKSLTYARGKEIEAAKDDFEVPLIITNDALITFAVCLDFCEDELPIPYDRMDVDLVLVASLGNVETMRGHESSADSLRHKFGGRAFVCQQSDKPDECVGFVYPSEEQGKPFMVEKPWNLRIIKFS